MPLTRRSARRLSLRGGRRGAVPGGPHERGARQRGRAPRGRALRDEPVLCQAAPALCCACAG